MTKVSITEAQRRLPNLLAAAEAGESVEIEGPSGRIFQLKPTRPRPPVTGKPKAGRWRGQLVVPDDFKEPLDEPRAYWE